MLVTGPYAEAMSILRPHRSIWPDARRLLPDSAQPDGEVETVVSAIGHQLASRVAGPTHERVVVAAGLEAVWATATGAHHDRSESSADGMNDVVKAIDSTVSHSDSRTSIASPGLEDRLVRCVRSSGRSCSVLSSSLSLMWEHRSG